MSGGVTGKAGDSLPMFIEGSQDAKVSWATARTTANRSASINDAAEYGHSLQFMDRRLTSQGIQDDIKSIKKLRAGEGDEVRVRVANVTLANLEHGCAKRIGAADLRSAQGKLIASLMSALAEFERDLLRERVRSGIAAARKRGVVFGRRPGQRVKADRYAPKS